MELPKSLKDEIWDYCRVNNISNIDEFTLKLLKQGFTVEKFGAAPTAKEKIIEKIVEVQVEKIVEKRIEVPIEKIVEKEVYITDDVETKKISDKLVQSIQNEQECKAANESNGNEIVKLKTELSEAKRLLEEEKNKGKRDLYGEK